MELSNSEIEIKSYRRHWFDLLWTVFWLLLFCPIGFYFFLKWYIERIVVTNQAVYLRKGIISRDVKRLPLRNIQDVSYEQGFFGRIFGFGTVKITSTTIGGILGYKCMPNPNETVLTISQAIEGAASRVNVESLPNQPFGNQTQPPAIQVQIINQPSQQPVNQNQPPSNQNS